MGKVLRHFSKDDAEIANKHMKRCSTSFKETQIETTRRHYFIAIRVTIIKKHREKAGQGVEEAAPRHPVRQ